MNVPHLNFMYMMRPPTRGPTYQERPLHILDQLAALGMALFFPSSILQRHTLASVPLSMDKG